MDVKTLFIEAIASPLPAVPAAFVDRFVQVRMDRRTVEWLKRLRYLCD
jgi:hypothetical protein